MIDNEAMGIVACSAPTGRLHARLRGGPFAGAARLDHGIRRERDPSEQRCYGHSVIGLNYSYIGEYR
jgi:hypothetical protein